MEEAEKNMHRHITRPIMVFVDDETGWVNNGSDVYWSENIVPEEHDRKCPHPDCREMRHKFGFAG